MPTPLLAVLTLAVHRDGGAVAAVHTAAGLTVARDVRTKGLQDCASKPRAASAHAILDSHVAP